MYPAPPVQTMLNVAFLHASWLAVVSMSEIFSPGALAVPLAGTVSEPV